MLNRAVKQYSTQPANHVPPRGTQQQRFASHATANPSSGIGQSSQQALQPSSSVTLNGSFERSTETPGALKRKAADMSSLAGAKDAGVLNQLHGGVFWDENDFVDDADIDLDEESLFQPSLPAASPPKAAVTPTPKNNIPATLSYPQLNTSQVEWSSSPIHHFQAPSRTLASTAQGDAQNEAPAIIDLSQDDEPVRASKRRHLPWMQNQPRITHQNFSAVPSVPKFESAARLDTSEGSVSYPTLPQATPASKTQSSTVDLWNKTASAIKEDQRKLRQTVNQNKKPKDDAESAPKVAALSKGAPSRDKRAAGIFLSHEQQKVLELIKTAKKSVFFTGSAGTGKSVLMREIIHVLKGVYAKEKDRVAVTASTGLAACNIGGVTLHSFSGIGLGKEAVEILVKKIKRNPKARQRWLRTKVLIVDEISMVDGDMFDKLEEIARIVRNNGRPFGGIQLVITGDFFQLPPVPERGKMAKFAFDAATWSTSIQHTIGLTHVFRQKDPEFASMLNEMRLGKLSNQSIASFRSLSRGLQIKDDIEATELFPTRNEVERANESRMRDLGGNVVDFAAQDGGTMADITKRTELLQNCMAPEKLSLKIGAQVMLIKNYDDTLVNGSIGKVINFMDEKTYDYSYEDRDMIPASEAAQLIGEDIAKFKMGGPRNTITTSQKYPIVQFQLADGTLRELLCTRETWKVEQPNGEIVASRSQVPLILAWALSIHKAQGQTLERVRVDLGKIFEKGQAYVALSRATTQEGLQILRFDPKKVMAHEKVRKFYDGLASIDKLAIESAASARVNVAKRAPARNDLLFLDAEDDESFAESHL